MGLQGEPQTEGLLQLPREAPPRGTLPPASCVLHAGSWRARRASRKGPKRAENAGQQPRAAGPRHHPRQGPSRGPCSPGVRLCPGPSLAQCSQPQKTAAARGGVNSLRQHGDLTAGPTLLALSPLLPPCTQHLLAGRSPRIHRQGPGVSGERARLLARDPLALSTATTGQPGIQHQLVCV